MAGCVLLESIEHAFKVSFWTSTDPNSLLLSLSERNAAPIELR